MKVYFFAATLILIILQLFQILNYGIGGQYTPHPDSKDRIATFMAYLSHVVEGGATVFVHLG